MDSAEGSRTAVLVCQGRAAAQGRLAVGRFDDPVSERLLRSDERAAVEVVRSGNAPKSWPDRMEYERLRATAEVMAPRTVAIDDAVAGDDAPQVVILGAGLDGRAWRMAALAGKPVFEIDHPASQEDKRERLAAAPGGPLEPVAAAVTFVPVDFARDQLADGLAGAGHRRDEATTWVWEGVVPYLTRKEIELTMEQIEACSARGSRLVVNYQSPSIGATFGLAVAQVLSDLAKRRNPTAKEPRRSAWTAEAMQGLMSHFGFTVTTDTDLATLAGGLGVKTRNPRSLRAGRVVVADR
ncbi:MAG TPA: class I SAM-dependent methyltransferase [Acidimicrobiia bacterium]|nr:class I SAM-dependent methyltransferase [Acidimicrobiia bacterium]